MRRRRRQNPLLAKTLLIGLGLTIVLLPVLASLGVFKQLHEQYVETQLINLPPPPPQPKEQKAKAKKTVHQHIEGHKGARITHATVQVHVQAGGPSKGAGDHGAEIVNKAPGGPVGLPPTGPVGPVVTTWSAPTTPAPISVAPTPTPAATPEFKPDVIVEAEPTYQPSPVIPDDLLDSDLDTTFFGYFTIHIDGTVDVKMVQGTGNSILDRLAMDAAKRWKFTPATKNGVPVESYRRLQVEFVVNDSN